MRRGRPLDGDGHVGGAPRPHAVDVALIYIVAVAAGEVVVAVEVVVGAAVRRDGLGVVAARRRLGRAGPHVASLVERSAATSGVAIKQGEPLVTFHTPVIRNGDRGANLYTGEGL